MDEEQEAEVEIECELCAGEHETRDCDQGLCGLCHELLDNCDCEPPEEITAEEWIRRGRPYPSRIEDVLHEVIKEEE
jgi:hypothetical protein